MRGERMSFGCVTFLKKKKKKVLTIPPSFTARIISADQIPCKRKTRSPNTRRDDCLALWLLFLNSMDVFSIKVEPEDTSDWDDEKNNGTFNFPESSGTVLPENADNFYSIGKVEPVSPCFSDRIQHDIKTEEACDHPEEIGLGDFTVQMIVKEDEDSDKEIGSAVSVATSSKDSDLAQEGCGESLFRQVDGHQMLHVDRSYQESLPGLSSCRKPSKYTSTTKDKDFHIQLKRFPQNVEGSERGENRQGILLSANSCRKSLLCQLDDHQVLYEDNQQASLPENSSHGKTSKFKSLVTSPITGRDSHVELKGCGQNAERTERQRQNVNNGILSGNIKSSCTTIENQYLNCKNPEEGTSVHEKSETCKFCERESHCDKNEGMNMDKSCKCQCCYRQFTVDGIDNRGIVAFKTKGDSEIRKAMGGIDNRGVVTFKTKGDSKKHKTMHKGETLFPCRICGKSFKNKSRCKTHEVSHTGEETLKCRFCDNLYFTEDALKRHERRHTDARPYKCQDCEMSFITKSQYKSHTKKHTDARPFKCQYCQKSFVWEGNLKLHEKIHTGEKSYSCNVCDKTFITRCECKKHKLVHTNERPIFQCQYCKKEFKQKSRCQRHEKEKAANGLPKCQVGGKSFQSRGTSAIHELMQNGEKLFQCQICEKVFKKRSRCVRHELVHTGEKLFQCQFCDKSFTQKSNCKKHEQIHLGSKPFKCQYCGKSFLSKANCERHAMIHTGEKPFKCKFCDKSFTTKHECKLHTMRHLDEKPFKCQDCEKSFVCRNECERHKITHSKKPFICKIGKK